MEFLTDPGGQLFHYEFDPKGEYWPLGESWYLVYGPGEYGSKNSPLDSPIGVNTLYSFGGANRGSSN
jgi:hypothetical protein